MLKLVYTPTNEITESDLVPGSRWRRVRDENGPLKEPYECVLIQHDRYWAIYRDWVACCAVGVCSGTLHTAAEMPTWLRRDFERVGGEHCPYKTVKEVPCGVMFDTSEYKRLIKVICGYDNDNILFADEWRVDQIIHEAEVTRVYGPIGIDDSVKGVG